MSRKRTYTGATRRAAFKGDETTLSEILTNPDINNLEDALDDAFISACAAGNFELVKNIIKKNTKGRIYTYECALHTVLWTGNTELYKYLFNVYENEILCRISNMTDKYHLYWLLNDTFLYGDYDTVDFILAKLAHIPSILQTFFKLSCEDGDFEMMIRLKQMGVSDINEGFIAACSKGHIEIVRHLKVDIKYEDIKDALIAACNNERCNIVCELLDMRKITLEESLEDVFDNVKFKSSKIIGIYIKRGVNMEVICDEISNNSYKTDKENVIHVRSLISAAFFYGKSNMLDWSRYGEKILEIYLNVRILMHNTKKFANTLARLTKRRNKNIVGMHIFLNEERLKRQECLSNILIRFVCSDICNFSCGFIGFFEKPPHYHH